MTVQNNALVTNCEAEELGNRLNTGCSCHSNKGTTTCSVFAECQLGRSDLQQDCVLTETLARVDAVRFWSTRVPTIDVRSDSTNTTQVRLAETNGGSVDEGVFDFVAPRTGEYAVYLSSPSIRIRIYKRSDPSLPLEPICTAAISAALVQGLTEHDDCQFRRFYSVSLQQGQRYRVQLGPITSKPNRFTSVRVGNPIPPARG